MGCDVCGGPKKKYPERRCARYGKRSTSNVVGPMGDGSRLMVRTLVTPPGAVMPCVEVELTAHPAYLSPSDLRAVIAALTYALADVERCPGPDGVQCRLEAGHGGPCEVEASL